MYIWCNFIVSTNPFCRDRLPAGLVGFSVNNPALSAVGALVALVALAHILCSQPIRFAAGGAGVSPLSGVQCGSAARIPEPLSQRVEIILVVIVHTSLLSVPGLAARLGLVSVSFEHAL